MPVVNWDKLGVSNPESLVPLTRASMDGPTSYQTYSGWLRKQTAAVQNQVLGPTRATLFRSGKVGLRDLVRSDGSVLTLDELGKKLGMKLAS